MTTQSEISMATMSAFEARTRFGNLLDRVAQGEEIVITRHDKPVARLVPEGRVPLRQVSEAVAELGALRREMKKCRALSPKEIRDAIAEGRRWRRGMKN
jgi:prevent-host-death family protein